MDQFFRRKNFILKIPNFLTAQNFTQLVPIGEPVGFSSKNQFNGKKTAILTFATNRFFFLIKLYRKIIKAKRKTNHFFNDNEKISLPG